MAIDAGTAVDVDDGELGGIFVEEQQNPVITPDVSRSKTNEVTGQRLAHPVRVSRQIAFDQLVSGVSDRDAGQGRQRRRRRCVCARR